MRPGTAHNGSETGRPSLFRRAADVLIYSGFAAGLFTNAGLLFTNIDHGISQRYISPGDADLLVGNTAGAAVFAGLLALQHYNVFPGQDEPARSSQQQ